MVSQLLFGPFMIFLRIILFNMQKENTEQDKKETKVSLPLEPRQFPRQKKGYVCGDSFVKIFTLCLNKEMQVLKFKGATMKGLTRAQNKNRKQIQALASDTRYDIDYFIFNFGQVDYNFSCYYKLVRQQPYEQEEIVREYFKWIDQLKVKNKLIINIYPSPLSKQTICGALIKYMILSKDQVIQNKQRIMIEFENQAERQAKWTQLLKDYTKMYEGRIKFIDLSNKILDKGNSVRKIYRDINPYNIHLRWKKLIYDLKEKIGKYLTLVLDDKRIEREESEYEKNKEARMSNEFSEYDYVSL